MGDGTTARHRYVPSGVEMYVTPPPRYARRGTDCDTITVVPPAVVYWIVASDCRPSTSREARLSTSSRAGLAASACSLTGAPHDFAIMPANPSVNAPATTADSSAFF